MSRHQRWKPNSRWRKSHRKVLRKVGHESLFAFGRGPDVWEMSLRRVRLLFIGGRSCP